MIVKVQLPKQSNPKYYLNKQIKFFLVKIVNYKLFCWICFKMLYHSWYFFLALHGLIKTNAGTIYSIMFHLYFQLKVSGMSWRNLCPKCNNDLHGHLRNFHLSHFRFGMHSTLHNNNLQNWPEIFSRKLLDSLQQRLEERFKCFPDLFLLPNFDCRRKDWNSSLRCGRSHGNSWG